MLYLKEPHEGAANEKLFTINPTESVSDPNRRSVQITLCAGGLKSLFNCSGLLLLFLFPVLQCTCFYLAIGDNPKNLKIGIVNDEVNHYEDCFNTSLITTYVHDDTCDLNKVSCRYLSRIPQDLTRQVILVVMQHVIMDWDKTSALTALLKTNGTIGLGHCNGT